MSFEWNTYNIKELINKKLLYIGDGYRAKNSELSCVGIPFARAGNINSGFNFENADLFPTNQLHKVGDKVSKAFDVVFTSKGTVGRFAFVKSYTPPFVYSPQLCFWRSLKYSFLDPRFLYYWMHSKEFLEQVYAVKGQTDMADYVSLTEQRRMHITIPEISEQIGIVRTLSALDDKIELNNAINKNLEEMAQALFKRWFVDFEFPNENGEPYKSSGGKFVESELGLIPKGWKLDCLDGIAIYLNGLAMQKYRPNGEQFIPVIKIRELNQGRTNSDSDKASPNIDKKYIVNNGDVLFSWSGTLDIKLWCGGIGGLNQHLFKVTSKIYDKWFYYYWTKHHIERFRRIASDKATTMGHIKRNDLKEAKVLIPDPNSYRKATDIFKPIVEKLIQLSVESFYLERVRDTLLPKLMSGEIRVPVEQDHNVAELLMVAESSAAYKD